MITKSREQMTKELKPCPFCGSEARFEVAGERGRICCSNEDCTAWDTAIFSTTQEAIKTWNMRTEKTCRWKPFEEGSSFEGPGWRCSNCGLELGPEDQFVVEYCPYCPMCAAKVVGE